MVGGETAQLVRLDNVTSKQSKLSPTSVIKDFDALVAHLALGSELMKSGSSSLPNKIDIAAIAEVQHYEVERGAPSAYLEGHTIHIPSYYTLRDESVTIAREIVRPIAKGITDACVRSCSDDLEPDLCKYLHDLSPTDQVDVFAAALFLPKANFEKWSKKINDMRTLANVFNLPIEFVALRKASLAVKGA